MVSAANISRLSQGKPVIISNKIQGTVANLVRAAAGTTGATKLGASGGTVVTSTSGASPTSLVIGGQTVKVASGLNMNATGTIVGRSSDATTTTQHVMIGNQLVKIQSAGAGTGTDSRGKPLILNNIGQTYKVQSFVQNQGKVIKVRVDKERL